MISSIYLKEDTMKKIFTFFMLILIFLSFTACSTNSPDKTVKGMMDSVKAWDVEAMKKYIPADKFYASTDMDSTSIESATKLMKVFVANLSYKILDTKVEGNTATVNLEISNVDMKPVMEEMLTQIFTLAFSGVDLTEAEGEAKVLEILTSSVDKNKTKLVTNKASLTLTKTQDGWSINEPSADFYDALLGGFISAADETNTMLNSQE